MEIKVSNMSKKLELVKRVVKDIQLYSQRGYFMQEIQYRLQKERELKQLISHLHNICTVYQERLEQEGIVTTRFKVDL
jgi:hypothetical protein